MMVGMTRNDHNILNILRYTYFNAFDINNKFAFLESCLYWAVSTKKP